MKVTSPCKDCEERDYNCHSTCEAYIEYTKKNKKRNEEIKYQKSRNSKPSKAMHRNQET